MVNWRQKLVWSKKVLHFKNFDASNHNALCLSYHSKAEQLWLQSYVRLDHHDG